MKYLVEISACIVTVVLAIWIWKYLVTTDIDCGHNYYVLDAYRVQDCMKAAGTCLYISNSSAWVPSDFTDEGIVIYSGLVDYIHNRRFIIVSQNKEMRDTFKYGDSNDGYYRENSTPYYYWIIDKRTDAVYGPMPKDDYMHCRKELNVPHRADTGA